LDGQGEIGRAGCKHAIQPEDAAVWADTEPQVEGRWGEVRPWGAAAADRGLPESGAGGAETMHGEEAMGGVEMAMAADADGEPSPTYARTQPAPKLKFGGVVRGAGGLLVAAQAQAREEGGDADEERGNRGGWRGREEGDREGGGVRGDSSAALDRGWSGRGEGSARRFEWLRCATSAP